MRSIICFLLLVECFFQRIINWASPPSPLDTIYTHHDMYRWPEEFYSVAPYVSGTLRSPKGDANVVTTRYRRRLCQSLYEVDNVVFDRSVQRAVVEWLTVVDGTTYFFSNVHFDFFACCSVSFTKGWTFALKCCSVGFALTSRTMIFHASVAVRASDFLRSRRNWWCSCCWGISWV